MNTVDFLEKGRQYAKKRYPDEYSDKADGRITHAFVDGAIYATVGAWRDLSPESKECLGELRNSFPVILINSTTYDCVFVDTNKVFDAVMSDGAKYTHYMPTEIPLDFGDKAMEEDQAAPEIEEISENI